MNIRASMSSKGTSATWLVALVVLGLFSVGAGVGQETSPASDVAQETPSPSDVIVASLQSIIHPVAAEYLAGAVEEAERIGAAALVIELDTPGGLMTSMREISTDLLNTDVPVVVYVAPSGAQAASAGFVLLLSADIAAMAPGTNTGAAHPVGGQGENIEGDMGQKVEQDMAANVRSLAARNGRNVEMAEAAVVESRSFTADEALELELIDLVAPSMTRLLSEIDGWELTTPDDEVIVLATADANILHFEMTPVQRLLSAIAHPNVAYILFTLGFLGLYFELSNPGAILPGVVGAISLVLGFYALSVLPLNYAGVALIFLAMLLFIAEIKVTSYGLLTVGGVVSLVLGSLMLFKSPDPAIQVSRSLIAAVTAAVVVTAVFLMTLVVKTHRSQVRTGQDGLVGEHGVTKTALTPAGKVFVHGEFWQAEAEGEVAAGERVEVVSVQGMLIKVRPLKSPGAAPAGTPSVEEGGT